MLQILISQKHAHDEFNDSDYNENFWETQRNHDTESENSVDNNYNELHQINFKICISESLLQYLKFINQSLEINMCYFIQVI